MHFWWIKITVVSVQYQNLSEVINFFICTAERRVFHTFSSSSSQLRFHVKHGFRNRVREGERACWALLSGSLLFSSISLSFFLSNCTHPYTCTLSDCCTCTAIPITLSLSLSLSLSHTHTHTRIHSHALALLAPLSSKKVSSFLFQGRFEAKIPQVRAREGA